MAAIARRTFAAVILKGAPPLRPRARADARPALVRSEIRSRSNSAFCGAPQNAEYAEPAVMRSDPIEVEVWPARWPIGAPHNIQRYGPQRFRDCGEVRSKDWTVWPEPGGRNLFVRAFDLSWLKEPGLCVARQTDITFETVRNRAVFCTGSSSRLRITAGYAYSASAAKMPNTNLPAGVVVSMDAPWPVSTLKPMLRVLRS
jgi:hypothetical protein